MYKRNFNRTRKHRHVTRYIREFENDDDNDHGLERGLLKKNEKESSI